MKEIKLCDDVFISVNDIIVEDDKGFVYLNAKYDGSSDDELAIIINMLYPDLESKVRVSFRVNQLIKFKKLSKAVLDISEEQYWEEFKKDHTMEVLLDEMSRMRKIYIL